MAVSAIVPTYERPEALIQSLSVISSCRPPPDEILVLIDHGDAVTLPVLREKFPRVRVFDSERRLGPGGARNRLIAAANHEIVASFDDDSHPIDLDYFARAAEILAASPRAGVLAASIRHDDEALPPLRSAVRPSATFIGCGCVYRREAFLSTGGFIAIQPAYGVEETDLALQLADAGWEILRAELLRVRHATSRGHQVSAEITSAHISNTALLAFLRYPPIYWGLGALQVVKRVAWSLKMGRFAGVIPGLLRIPSHLWRYRHARAPVRTRTLKSLRKLRSDGAT
ncbi:glycosyltransferase [Limibaculum sp. FT325]|nr:glycosyltransferase [Limibaculum sediminis]